MKLRPLLELMRVSNLPTVWSNAWMGWVAGLYIVAASGTGTNMRAGWLMTDPFALAGGFLLAFAMSLIYTGGMVQNDYMDRAIDAAERPGRPIPSGRVRAESARLIAWALLVAGPLVVIAVSRWCLPGNGLIRSSDALAIVLVAVVAQYNDCHQRYRSTVVLMAACRALLILTCASVALGSRVPLFHAEALIWIILPAGVLLIYTLAISVIARREVDPERGGFGGPKTVMNMIAAMPLLDAVWLVVMGLWPASLVCVACAGLTKLGHRRIAGS